jgi:monovalent cation:H+ antiporter-2, CPA2 family
MAAPISPESYKEAILFLATAGIVVPLFHRLRLSPVLGFIGAGALLGPFGLGRFEGDVPWLRWITIGNSDEISHLAEFGVVFLLFMIGIELSYERLRTLRRLVFGLGSLQVAVTAAVLGLVAAALGQGAATAVILGLALALSSTAIVVPVLAERKRLGTPAGRATFAVLLFQDLAVAPILFTLAALAGRESSVGLAFGAAFLQAAAALVLIVGVGRLALRPLFQLVAATRSPELFMAACLLVVLATGLVAAVSGLSMAIGAFVAGLLLAETEYRRAIEAMIDPFKGLLLGVFFVSVGMSLDWARLIEAPLLILASLAGLLGLKALVAFALARLFRLSQPVSLETALLLASGGEFAFVLIAAALSAKLLPEGVAQGALLVATLSMVAVPALARLGRSIGGRIDAQSHPRARAEPPPPSDEVRVIVAGFGRVGQLVAEMLARHDVPYIAIDADPARVAAARRMGKPVYFGDSSHPDLLHRCGIGRARALVVTLDAPRVIETVVATARAARPDLTIVARARDARHATALYELGVDDAVPETIEASLQLSEAVLVDIGVPMGHVIASVHERREEFRRVLKSAEDGAAPAAARPFAGRRSRQA